MQNLLLLTLILSVCSCNVLKYLTDGETNVGEDFYDTNGENRDDNQGDGILQFIGSNTFNATQSDVIKSIVTDNSGNIYCR